jgi:predicted GIY-YIG superfamily endonuclease
MMSVVYILQFPNGKFYIGSSIDLDRRLKQHGVGHTPSTKRLGQGVLVFSQEYATLSEARSVEKKLTALKRHDYVAKIVKDGYIKLTL